MNFYQWGLLVYVGIILFFGRDMASQDMATGLVLFILAPYWLGYGAGRKKGVASADKN